MDLININILEISDFQDKIHYIIFGVYHNEIIFDVKNFINGYMEYFFPELKNIPYIQIHPNASSKPGSSRKPDHIDYMDQFKYLLTKGKIFKIDNVPFSTQGHELNYFLIKSSVDSSMKLLIFQEDYTGKMLQLTSPSDKEDNIDENYLKNKSVNKFSNFTFPKDFYQQLHMFSEEDLKKNYMLISSGYYNPNVRLFPHMEKKRVEAYNVIIDDYEDKPINNGLIFTIMYWEIS